MKVTYTKNFYEQQFGRYDSISGFGAMLVSIKGSREVTTLQPGIFSMVQNKVARDTTKHFTPFLLLLTDINTIQTTTKSLMFTTETM